MKYSNLQAFEKHLKEAAPHHLSSIYLLLVHDAFERKAAVERLLPFLLQGEQDPRMSVKTFDGERCAIQEVLEELNTFSFFSKKRVILIQNADALSKSACLSLENYYAHPSPSVYLVIAAEKLNKATNFYKKGEKAGVVLELLEEKPWVKEKNLLQYLTAKSVAEGKSITPQVCTSLLQHVGVDTAAVHQEFEKLLCYIGERKEITMQDVAAITTQVNVESGWQLGDAIFCGDIKAALRITKGLMKEGTPFLGLLRQIRTQFQTKYQICSILSQKGGPDEVMKEFPYMKGQILQRNMQVAQNYGMQRFKKGMLCIDETELFAKNSAAAPDVIAEILITKLTVR